MTRTICNVGQGGMCIEDFGNYKIVFDCGTISSSKNPQDVIKEFFDSKDRIKAVFISHLDADHVNCLQYLIKHSNVERVFIPLITDDEYAIVQYQNFKLGGSRLTAFVDMLHSNTIGTTRIIKVKPTPLLPSEPEMQSESLNSEPLNMDNNDIVSIDEINSGTEIFIHDFIKNDDGINKAHPCWVFKPYNFRYPKRHASIIKELENLGFNVDDTDLLTAELAKMIGHNSFRNKIKDIYINKIEGTINGNSMVVFSGKNCMDNMCYSKCKNFAAVHHKECCFWESPHIVCESFVKCGCLHTGDYEAKGKIKWDHLRTYYKKYWSNIGLFQVPHHGSRHNFNEEMTLLDAILFIYAGRKHFRHPHPGVLKSIVASEKRFLWVHEETSPIKFEINC